MDRIWWKDLFLGCVVEVDNQISFEINLFLKLFRWLIQMELSLAIIEQGCQVAILIVNSLILIIQCLFRFINLNNFFNVVNQYINIILAYFLIFMDILLRKMFLLMDLIFLFQTLNITNAAYSQSYSLEKQKCFDIILVFSK